MGSKHWSDVAINAALSAASKAGVELEGLEIKYATIEATWGDRVGLVVIGGSEELRTRTASFLIKWLDKNLSKLTKRSYENQVSVDYEPRKLGWLSQASSGRNGADGVFSLTPPSYYSDEQKADYLARMRPALGIGCVYYPCAD